jgi:predicted aspartyl protease
MACWNDKSRKHDTAAVQSSRVCGQESFHGRTSTLDKDESLGRVYPLIIQQAGLPIEGQVAMRPKGSNGMGRFNVKFVVANNDDLALVRRGLLPQNEVRRHTVSGVVDSGAAKLVLPQALVKQLGLPLGDKINVRYADGRQTPRREAEGVYVELMGRHGTFTAIVEPSRKTALIGAIVLEDLDFLVDCQHQRLIPRDPSGPIFEIE